MAKDLAEEIRSLGSEREGLEALLGRLVPSPRDARKLGCLREDQDRLRRELAHGTAAHGEWLGCPALYVLGVWPGRTSVLLGPRRGAPSPHGLRALPGASARGAHL